MRTSTFRANMDRGPGTEQVEVRDTTSNTLDSIGYTPLGLILLGEDWGPGKGYNILWSSPVNTLGPGGPRLRCIGERINRTFANKLRDEPRISLPAQGLPKDVTTHTCTVQQQPDDDLKYTCTSLLKSSSNTWIYLSIETVAIYHRRSPKRVKT